MSKELPQKIENIEEVLIRENNLTVIKPEKFELPSDLNLRAIEDLGIDEEEAKDTANFIASFLNENIIIDQFDKDHTARRVWRKQIEIRYGLGALKFLSSNKLRVNSFSPILGFFAKIELHIRNKPVTSTIEKVKSLREKYSQIVSGYPDMDINQKIETVKRLNDWFKEILGLFE